MEETPHRVVNDIATGFINAVRGTGNSVVSSLKGGGEGIMRALDGPFTSITGKEGPHRIVGILANGAIDAGVNFVDKGLIGTLEIGGRTIMEALDHLPEQTGIPPKLPTLRK